LIEFREKNDAFGGSPPLEMSRGTASVGRVVTVDPVLASPRPVTRRGCQTPTLPSRKERLDGRAVAWQDECLPDRGDASP
jgi:hypothetical protein